MTRAKRYYLSMAIPKLQPGEPFHAEFTTPLTFRPDRLTIKVDAESPQIRFYQRKAGGSKRRGRLASIRFNAALMRHPHLSADLLITSVRVNANSQIIGGPIPASIFDPNVFPFPVTMDECPPHRKMEFDFVNNEFARVVYGAFGCFGTVIEQ